MHALLRLLMRAWSRDVTDALSTMPRAHGAPHVRTAGPNPDRVLLFGNGLAVGWGVASHELAIPGELTRSLSALTGRGAEVDIAAYPELKLAGVHRAIEERDLGAYDAIIAIVGSSDTLSLTPRAHWRSTMRGLLAMLVARSSASTRIMVIGIPQFRRVPPFDNAFGKIASSHATTLNAVTRELCLAHPRVSYTLLSSAATQSQRLGTPERYRLWGRDIANQLVPALNDAARSSTTSANPRERAPQTVTTVEGADATAG
ncbi:SGNH/GDSL hydrolase family protein [Parafrigoribacterium soli]|uniref:hypothetical protein n=1 Tax=Parafrigoribacterium soli TaxID=3144663 RepID=UPI0032EFCF05